MQNVNMPGVSAHTTTLVTTIVGALASIGALTGIVIPKDITSAIVTLVLFVLAAIFHLLSHKTNKKAVVQAAGKATADSVTKGPGPTGA